MAWATAGADLPPLPDESDPRVEVWRDGAGGVAAYAYTSRGTSWVRLPGIGAFAFDRKRDEVTAFPDRGVTRGVVAEAYRRAVLPMVEQARGRQVLHASAVRASAGVVAFSGTSGVGKSTVAYAFSRRGYPVWGDDAVCFETSDPGIDSIPLPFDLLLRPSTALFFKVNPDAARMRRLNSESEASAAAPLSAVCVLQPGVEIGRRPPVEVVPFTSADAFTATLEHAYALGLDDKLQRRQPVQHYLHLTATTAVFGVSFERGLEHLEAVVDEIERRLGLQPPIP